MRSDLPTGTVTFLFTDVVGSTRLLHSLGPDTYADALGAHRKALRDAFAAHGGVEVDTQGDAFLAAFATAAGAAGAATSGHAALAEGPIRVRIGLHTGTPTVTAEGYVGIDVHRGARIASLAHAGQTLVSETTATLLEAQPLFDLGRHRLKDFDAPVRLLQLGSNSHPPLRTPGAVDLPTPATPFIGRERELYEAVALALEHDPRVLTVLGPGGTGKTRFAIELARLLAEDAEGGTLFVPLAPVREAELVLPTIADRSGAGSHDSGSIAAHLRDRRTHVVVDNVEHLLPDAAGMLAELAGAAPTLRLLVTSREALRIQGEEQFDLPPLVEAEAVTLFLSRAHAVRSDLEHTPVVEELCSRLDCLPLALELAAARTKLLTPQALLERLGARLDLLKGGRDVDPRHATLRATIAWSYELLNPAERDLFASLSVFAAGCTLESAEAVCGADLPTLESLLDKSLLRRRPGLQGEERLWMLETIREVAAERREVHDSPESIQRRHAEHMLTIVRAAHLEDDGSSDPQQHQLVLAELADIRLALDWTAANDVVLGIELTVALENHWAATHPEEGARRIADLLSRAETVPPELRAAALRVQGGALYRSGDFESGRRLYEESLQAFREVGDERGAANLLARIAVDVGYFGDPERARSLADEVVELGRTLEMPRLEAEGLGALASVHRRARDFEGALLLARRSAEVAQDCGFFWWQSNMLAEMLELSLELGRLDEAEHAGREAVRLATTMDDQLVALWAITGLALIERQRGNLARAGRLWGAVDAEATREPPPQGEGFREFTAPLVALSDPRFLSGYSEGRGLPFEDAIALALGDDQTLP